MMGILARIKAGVLAALVFVGVVVSVWWAGRSKGKTEQRAEHNEETVRNQAQADNVVNEVHNETNKLPAGGANDQLRRKWMRKKN